MWQPLQSPTALTKKLPNPTKFGSFPAKFSGTGDISRPISTSNTSSVGNPSDYLELVRAMSSSTLLPEQSPLVLRQLSPMF